MPHSLRGMVTNRGVPALVQACNPEWMYAEFGPVTCDLTRSFTRADGTVIPWALHHFSKVPNPYDVSIAMQHPSYSGWHILGTNEADIAGSPPGAPWSPTPMNPQEYVTLCMAQMDAVREADPDAQFNVWGGTQWHPPFAPDGGWLAMIWTLFPRGTHRNYIKAIGTDYYVQGDGYVGRSGNPAVWLQPDPVKKYFRKFREALDAMGLPGRELWCHEIGLATDERLNPEAAANYPATVQGAMDEIGVQRWSWFTMMPFSTYFTLMDGTGALTPTGATFAGLV